MMIQLANRLRILNTNNDLEVLLHAYEIKEDIGRDKRHLYFQYVVINTY